MTITNVSNDSVTLELRKGLYEEKHTMPAGEIFVVQINKRSQILNLAELEASGKVEIRE